MARKRILIFADYYLPSVGAGGGVRLLANIVERFSDRYDFFVVARDHDSKTDRLPFKQVPLNEWTRYGVAETYYFSKNRLNAGVTEQILRFADPDIVFLNSLFSVASVRFLWERRKGKYKGLPVVVSPCGEVLSEGLKHKPLKKKSYLKLANTAGLHDGLIWRATSEKEKADIEVAVKGNPKIFVVPDLAPKEIKPEAEKPEKISGVLKLSYIARIVPNKNLLFLLDLLKEPIDGSVSLEIIGPQENAEYWAKCLSAIDTLPSNITVSVAGLVSHEETLMRLRDSHVFILPTETENFGYVILEALALGCPVVISDRTHWNYLEGSEYANVLGLEAQDSWRSSISKFVSMNKAEFSRVSEGATDFAENWLASSDAEAKMEQIFQYAIGVDSRAAVR